MTPAGTTKILLSASGTTTALDGTADWLATLRRGALARYGQLGLPGPRTEAWKFTNLNRLTALDFVASDAALPDRLPALPVGFADLDSARVVLVDGAMAPTLSDTAPEGVEIVEVAADGANAPGWVSETLGTIADHGEHPFAALNTGSFGRALAIRVARGAMPEQPIHLVHLSTGGSPATISHPRVLVVVDEGASVDLVETHIGSGAYLRNSVTEVVVGRDARVGHYKLQADGADAFHVAMTAVRAEASSTYDNFALSTGARLARNEVRATLAGRHIDYRVNGGYLATGEQHLDTTTFIDHAEPDCASHELYKGVLADRARGVFQGKILVRPDAQKTDGYQMNRALLLSREAEVNSKPELEIYADDVKCSHGATVGELEDDQLFYLMARGISRERARAILVAAYVDEAVDQISREPVREAFRATAADWMHHHIAGAEG